MKISEKDIGWQIHSRTAIGDADGTVFVNESLNSFSSSILEITTEHTDIEVSSKYINQISSPMCKFDSIYRYYLQSPSQPFFLKIDVQGFEDKVLNGASEAINQAVGILVELSTVELYAGQKLFNEMIEYFQDHKNNQVEDKNEHDNQDLNFSLVDVEINEPNTSKNIAK